MRILLREHGSGEVALAGIREQGDNGVACIFRSLGQLRRRKDRRAGRNADEQALLPRQRAAGGKGVLIFHGEDLVIDGGVERLRHEARADALDLVRAGRALGQDRRTGRLNRNDAHVRVLRLQIFARARDGAAGADACNENIDGAIMF